jgi:hypothetical protein
LAPKAILAQVSNLIQDFLLQRGKGNQRKFHLVNWETVKRPINEGGLQIRDPGLANITLGGKIIWKLFSNSSKYLQGNSMRNLKAGNTTKGTLIWNLCRAGLDFFQIHLYRIPDKGKKR